MDPKTQGAYLGHAVDELPNIHVNLLRKLLRAQMNLEEALETAKEVDMIALLELSITNGETGIVEAMEEYLAALSSAQLTRPSPDSRLI